jgi:hypothetical protein
VRRGQAALLLMVLRVDVRTRDLLSMVLFSSRE